MKEVINTLNKDQKIVLLALIQCSEDLTGGEFGSVEEAFSYQETLSQREFNGHLGQKVFYYEFIDLVDKGAYVLYEELYSLKTYIQESIEEVQPVKEEVQPVEEEEVQPVKEFTHNGLKIKATFTGYNRNWKEELSFFTDFGIHEMFHRDLYLAYNELKLVSIIIENLDIPVKQAYDMFKMGWIIISKEDEVQPKEEEEETMIVKRLSKKQIDFLKSVSSLDFSLTENGKWIEVHNAPKLIKELENTASLTPSKDRRFLVQLVRKIKGLNGEEVEIKTRKKRTQEKVKPRFTKAEQDLIDYCKAIKKDLKAHLHFMVKMGVSIKVCNNVLGKLDEPVKEPAKEPAKEEPVKEPVKGEPLEIPTFTLLPSSLQSAIKSTCLDLVQPEDLKVNGMNQSLLIHAPFNVCLLLRDEILTCLDVNYTEALHGVIEMIEMELNEYGR